jgi:MFS family permease
MERKWWSLLAVCLATFMLLLDITVVNVALPDIQKDLDTDLTGLQWVVDAYTLTLAAFTLAMGTLADRFGRRRLFVIGSGCSRSRRCSAGSRPTRPSCTSRGVCRASAARRCSRPRWH